MYFQIKLNVLLILKQSVLFSLANDEKNDRQVAIKKMTRPFDTPDHGKRTYRELKLLSFIKCENVVDLINVYTPNDSPESLTDL